MDIYEIVKRSSKIRALYHQLEMDYHGSEWTIEEVSLAFLTDAGLAGRLIMAQQKRWPKEGNLEEELEHKLGECIWWLIILAERMNIDIVEALDHFLTETEKQLDS